MCVDVFSAWAVVDVSMEDWVDVSLKGQAEIPCIYTLKEPAKMIVWFTVRNRPIHTLHDFHSPISAKWVITMKNDLKP